ncbi:MAG: hypothetical protein H6R08_846, partial [Proteobacteria bacterium]|nr:hypothetical protein [Pseudomonadota bacterium]
MGERDLPHRFEQIAARIFRRGFLARCIKLTAVLQLEITVKAEKIGRAYRT